MVAAIVLHKKRLVDILDEACELDPLEVKDDPSFLPLSKTALTTENKRRRKDPHDSWEPDCRPRAVSFSEGPPKVLYFNNYDSCTTEADLEQMKRTLWYTREDFNDFLLDRIHTIRVWRSVGGEMSELHEHYCLRGLEPYQSPALNAEMNSHRYMYTRSILREQERVRALSMAAGSGPHGYDLFQVAHQVAHMSKWAMEQARLLGLKDEEEAKMVAQEVQQQARPVSTMLTDRRRKSSLSRRHTMDHTSGPPPPSAASFSRVAPAVDTSSLLPSSPSSVRKNNVDVNLLKAMNMQFLQSFMASKRTSTSAFGSSLQLECSCAPQHEATPGGAATPSGKNPSQRILSLNALMGHSGHSASVLHQRHSQFPQQQQQHLMPATRRRHSLDFDSVERNESIMSQPFLAIRRDSLHGLGHSSD